MLRYLKFNFLLFYDELQSVTQYQGWFYGFIIDFIFINNDNNSQVEFLVSSVSQTLLAIQDCNTI